MKKLLLCHLLGIAINIYPNFLLANNSGIVWDLDIPAFVTSEDPYTGWKVSQGEAILDTASSPPAIVLSLTSGTVAEMYSYVPFYASIEGEERYLQICAEFVEPDVCGLVANASEGGSILGAYASGITTYSLSQHYFFTDSLDGKKVWALNIWAGGQPARIEGISVRAQISDGIIIQSEQNMQMSPNVGDKLRVTLYTTDETLRKNSTIDAKLVAYTEGFRDSIVSLRSSGGPHLKLQKSEEGVFTASIVLDQATLALIKAHPKSPSLGVQVTGGKVPLLGWINFPVIKEEVGVGEIDWQYHIGDATNSHVTWKDLTQGEDLARGKEVRLIPESDYEPTKDENDSYDLTDGKLSVRSDDRIWFEKDAVGWYGAGGVLPSTITLLLDLGKVEPVGQIAIRLLAGKEQNGLRLPNGIEFYASEDGESFHLLQQMQKLMPAERALSDFKTAFYVPEEGKAFVQAFACKEAVNARFIAIRIRPEASVFTDQISVTKAETGDIMKPLNSFPTKPFFNDGVIARPRQPEFTIFPGVHAHNWVVVENFNKGDYQNLNIQIDLPPGVKILPDDKLNIQETNSEGDTHRRYLITNAKAIPENRFSIYLDKQAEIPLAEDAEITLTTIVDGAVSHKLSYPLRERVLPTMPALGNLDISLTWMYEDVQIAWPNFFSEFRKLGFNFASTFPNYWQNRDSKRSWVPGVKPRFLKFLSEAKGHGYKVVMNESPFHEMFHTIAAIQKAGESKPEYEKGLYLQSADGKPTTHISPFYRGYYYQQEINRIKELTRDVAPDHIYWDIEFWWESVEAAKKDAQVVKQWKASGKEWTDFVTDAGTEMLRDLYNAVKEAMAGKPMPVIGLYGAYAAQQVPTDSVYEWSKIYPNYITISMPSLYVQGRTADVAQRIKTDYPKVGRNIIPWLTAATYGPVSPPAMESMVLESILNGSRGVTYYEYRDFDPLHLYYHAKAIATLGAFPDLMREGSPKAWQGDNNSLSYTCFASDNEALLMIGNYGRSSDNQAKIPSVISNAVTTEIIDGEKVELNDVQSGWETTVPPGGFTLYHQKRK